MQEMYASKPMSFFEQYGTKIVLAISWIGIFLFVYTAYSKLTDFGTFERGLSHLKWIGNYSVLLAYGIVISELLIAILLMFQRTILVGFYAFTGLMMSFTGYILMLMVLGLKLPCYCGGVIREMTWKEHVLFNLIFIFLGLVAIYLIRTNNNLKQ